MWVIDDPDDAETTISGLHQPEPGFFRIGDAHLITEAEPLLRKIRGGLALAPVYWTTYLFDDLIREIDALLGDEANGQVHT